MTHYDHTLRIEDLIRESDWLRRLARTIVRDPNTADDATQDVLMEATLRPPADGVRRSWLAKVLRHRVIDSRRTDLIRRRNRERLAAQTDTVPSAAEMTERATLQREVVDAVLELSDSQRQIVLLRYYHDLPPREIAARLDLPINTVKSHLQRGLLALRSRLHERRGPDWRRAIAPIATWTIHRPARSTSRVLAGSAARVVGLAAVGIGVIATIVIMATRPADNDKLDLGSLETTVGSSPKSKPPTTTASLAAVADAVSTRRNDGPSENSPQQDAPPKSAIRVVDSEGRGIAGIPVRLTERTLDDADIVWRGTTNSGGIADIDVALAARRLDNRCVDLIGELDFFDDSGSECILDLHAEEVGIVDILLAPYGKVDVAFPEGRWTYRLRSARRDIAPSADGNWRKFRIETGIVDNEKLHIPFIGLDRLVNIEIEPADRSLEAKATTFAGPVVSGASTNMVLKPGPPRLRVRGVLVASDGRPLADTAGVAITQAVRRSRPAVDVPSVIETPAVFPSFARRPRVEFRTDADGRFDLPWLTPGTRAPKSWLLTLVVGKTVGEARGLVQCRMPQRLEGSTIDLGRLVAVVPRLSVAGRVVDDLGHPIQGATIKVKAVAENQPATRSRSMFGRTTRQSGRTFKSDAEGRFEVFGFGASPRIRATVSHPDHLTTELIDIAFGTRDAWIELTRGGAIAGRVLLDRPLDGNAVEVMAVGALRHRRTNRTRGGVPMAGGRIGGDLRGDGRFVLRGLRPGRLTLRVRVNQRTVETIENVEVVAGETTHDQRIAGLDLRSKVRLPGLLLVDTNGRPMGHVRLEIKATDDLRSGSSSSSALLTTDEWGRFDVTRFARFQSMEVMIEGHRTAIVNLADDEQTVVAHPALAVEARFPDIAALLAPNEQLQVVLLDSTTWSERMPPRVRARERETSPRGVVEDGRVIVEVPNTVTYEIDVRLVTPKSPNGHRIAVAPKAIDVRDDSSVQSFEITISRENLAQARAKDA